VKGAVRDGVMDMVTGLPLRAEATIASAAPTALCAYLGKKTFGAQSRGQCAE
jgi:hypothetical protein